MNRSSGFTILEALIALVILSSTFAVVWEWFGTSIQATRKIEHAMAMPETISQFLIYLELESLEETHHGSVEIGRYTVTWDANPIRQNNQEPQRRQPAWIVTLFTVDVSVYTDGKLVEQFKTKTYRQWRDPSFVELPGGVIRR